MIEMQGAFGLPGIDSIKETTEKMVWWGDNYYRPTIIPVFLDGAARDAGNTPTDLLRPGLLLGRVTATGKWMEWTPAAVNGSEHIAGILLYDQKMQAFGSNKDRWFGYAMVRGGVKAAGMLVPGGSSYGINGDAQELMIRALLTQTGRFIIDDEPQGNPFGGWQRVVAKTADYTITEADNNTIFTNRGASGAVVFTLPATARNGFRVRVYAVADQSITVASGTADKLVAFNDAAADSVALSTASEKIGGSYEFIGTASGDWLVIPNHWGLGATAQTGTIAT